MSLPPASEHFQGKPIPEHLKEARLRGNLAAAEVHGTEMAGHFGAAADACKETTLALFIFWMALHPFSLPFNQVLLFLFLFSCGWLIWKTGRSALLGWARMERLHRLIEQERWEIEHHREQEREELHELYKAKGFSGKLLDEVVDVLMADDNRLLKIMLEEELGVTLEAYEHPLKQAAGALIGTLIAAAALLIAFFLSPLYGLGFIAFFLLIAAAAFGAKLEKNQVVPAVVWTLGLALLAGGAVHFLAKLFVHP